MSEMMKMGSKTKTKSKKNKKNKKNTRNKSQSMVQRPSKQVKRKRRRKKNMFLYYLIAFTLITTTFVVLSLTVFFKLEKINISGESIYSREQIIKETKFEESKNLLLLNTVKAKERILNNLTYVDTVEISRHLPSSINIKVTACKEFANLKTDNGFVVIDKNGKVLKKGLAAKKDKLLLVKGFKPKEVEENKIMTSIDENKEEMLSKILNEISKNKFEKITEVDINDKFDIIIVFDDRVKINVGSSQDLSYKIRYSKKIIEKEQEKNNKFKGSVTLRGQEATVLIE